MAHLIYDSRCTSFEYQIRVMGYIIHGAGRIKIILACFLPYSLVSCAQLAQIAAISLFPVYLILIP